MSKEAKPKSPARQQLDALTSDIPTDVPADTKSVQTSGVTFGVRASESDNPGADPAKLERATNNALGMLSEHSEWMFKTLAVAKFAINGIGVGDDVQKDRAIVDVLVDEIRLEVVKIQKAVFKQGMEFSAQIIHDATILTLRRASELMSGLHVQQKAEDVPGQEFMFNNQPATT